MKGIVVGIVTSLTLLILSVQAEPITGGFGLFVAAIHGIASYKLWHESQS